MPSKDATSKIKKRNEQNYYEPIKEHLTAVFSNRYVEHKNFPLQYDSYENMAKNLHLEVVGGKNRFSETLKNELKDDTLVMMRNEHDYPDIVGFVQKNPQSEKEIIIAEVKDAPLTLTMIVQTKVYQEVFNAKFAFLISTFELPAEKVRYLLKKPSVMGDIIIAKFKVTDPKSNLGNIEINSKFKDIVPEAFRMFCKPREPPPVHPKPNLFKRLLKR